MKIDGSKISLATAADYMNSIKGYFIDKFHSNGCPKQMQDEIWKRYMFKIRSIKFEESRKANTALFGHTDAASEEDKNGFNYCLLMEWNLCKS